MEGSHVWAGDGAELDLFGLVILVGVYLKVIGVVLLPLSLIWGN